MSLKLQWKTSAKTDMKNSQQQQQQKKKKKKKNFFSLAWFACSGANSQASV